jgi:hypothetical protein
MRQIQIIGIGVNMAQFLNSTGFGENIITDKPIGQMSQDEYNQYLDKVKQVNSRGRQVAFLNAGLDPSLFDNNSSLNNSGSTNTNASTSSANSSTDSTGLLGSLSGLGDATAAAKDLAQFNVGITNQEAQNAAALRETESQNNFGRTTKLTDQTYGWQNTINQNTQDALTKRNTDQLDTQKQMQNTDIGQQNYNTQRAIGLATQKIGG